MLVCLVLLKNPPISESIATAQVARCFSGEMEINKLHFTDGYLSDNCLFETDKKVSQVLWHVGFICSPAVLWICWGCSETDCQNALRVGGGLAAAPAALYRHQLKTRSDTALPLK